jgi:hypothetical protein
MLTKTKTYNKKDDQEVGHYFSVPGKIQDEINEKWFSLYNWIWEKDVKMSIERDFLKYISKFWTIVAVTLILPSIVLLYIESPFFYIYFFWWIWFINALSLIFLIIISIKRSNILRKNSNILVTDSSISINWKIRKLENNKIISNQNLNEIWELFEEKLFKNSNIEKTKNWFLKQVKDQLTKWYSLIMKMWKWWGKDSWKAVLLLLVLYSIYSFSLWIIYFIWILTIWVFWIFISIINKLILLKTGHEITVINDNFENIDSDSKSLIKEKNNLSKLLTDAIKNDWKDSLLKKINSWIENINNHASDAIETSIVLKKDIKKSKYKEMFNFNIYNSWIKKQIYTPLKQILELLENNLDVLKENKIKIEKQITNTIEKSLQWALIANKKRIEMKIIDIEKHMKKISIYINKLI